MSAAQLRQRGRPPCCTPELAIFVIGLRRQGLTLAQISAVLNREGVPTPDGRLIWQKSYVDRLLHTRYAREIWDGWDNTSAELIWRY